MTPHGIFHWNELSSWDPKKAAKFYTDTIGWEFETMKMPGGGDYYIAKVGDAMVAGIFPMSSPEMDGAQESWIPYLSVDDIDKRVEMARNAGATIIREPFDIPGTGRMALINEPGGAIVGWMTPSE